MRTSRLRQFLLVLIGIVVWSVGVWLLTRLLLSSLVLPGPRAFALTLSAVLASAVFCLHRPDSVILTMDEGWLIGIGTVVLSLAGATAFLALLGDGALQFTNHLWDWQYPAILVAVAVTSFVAIKFLTHLVTSSDEIELEP